MRISCEAIDNFYLDLTGLDRYFGAWQWARTLGAEIVSQTGLPLSLSLATNKLVAKVGANVGKPRVERLVPPGTERAFFAPLPVRQLPGVGRKTTHRLAQMGVRRLETLAGIPPELLLREFGPPGKKLWRQANARDTSRVIPHDAKRELRREHVLATDTTDATLLRRHLRRLALDLGYELRRNQRLTSQLTVKIVYVDRDTHVRRQRIAHTATDARLTAVADRLFVALFRRRQLVRAVGVKAGGLACGAPQLDLFGTDVRDQRLSAALDGIRNRFGQSLV
ncbi:MAG: DNA polymerase IV [Bacteroidota bacterium]